MKDQKPEIGADIRLLKAVEAPITRETYNSGLPKTEGFPRTLELSGLKQGHSFTNGDDWLPYI